VVGSTLIGLATNLLRSASGQRQDSLDFAKYCAIAKAFAPTTACLFIANYFNGVALQLSGITLTYVVKATIPVFTVLHASLIKRESFSTKVYLSIVPTVCGVALAAWSDSDVSSRLKYIHTYIPATCIRDHDGHPEGVDVVCLCG
jgi:drug/metabolite transporter (DMT)-like permease